MFKYSVLKIKTDITIFLSLIHLQIIDFPMINISF